MKKLIAIILTLCLFPVIALADVDLSSMSLEELQLLRKNVCSEILSRSKWDSVTVPSGFTLLAKTYRKVIGQFGIKILGLSFVTFQRLMKQGKFRTFLAEPIIQLILVHQGMNLNHFTT